MCACCIAMVPFILFRFKNPTNNTIYTKCFGPMALKLVGIKLKIEGQSFLDANTPTIFVMNHQSMLDMPIASTFFPKKTVLIGKKELRYIPIWGLMYEAFGNILIDRNNKKNSFAGLSQALKALHQQSLSIFIFPEGTRNRGPGLLPFKKGAFYMATQAKVPITPIVCSSIEPFFDLKKRGFRSVTLQITILEPYLPEWGDKDEVSSVMLKVRENMVLAYNKGNNLCQDG